MKRDLTIELDEETFQIAEITANGQGVSVETLLADLITAMVTGEAPR